LFDPTTYASRALTIAAELVKNDEAVNGLDLVLETIHDDLVGDNTSEKKQKKGTSILDATTKQPVVNDIFRPHQLPDTHFMRFVVVTDERGPVDNKLPWLLVWESNHDGPPVEYLRACQTKALSGEDGVHLDFDRVFGACVAYPGLKSGERWIDWMMDHAVRAEAFYSGYRGVPKTRVDAAQRVHAVLRTYLDEHRARLAKMPRREVHAELRAHLAERVKQRVAHPDDPMFFGLEPDDLEPAIERGLGFQLRKFATYTMIACAVVLAIALLPVTVAAIAYLRYRETKDQPETAVRAVHGLPDLIAVEDRIVQNQLTHLVDLKPGRFRYVVQRIVLLAIDQLARVTFVHGELGGISSIHFARWVILHDRREDLPSHRRRHRLLFFSNYDFSWDSYLGEFVDRASGGLTAVWSNTEGYPRTKWLINEGADDEETFKQWARTRQIASQVWWSGVRYSSVENVNNDIAIHRGIARDHLTPDQLERWLLRL
jgi:hypothetical protein